MESLGLTHVDLCVDFTVEERVGDVDEAQVMILACSERQNRANGLEARRASKDLEIVEPRTLAEALSDEARLVAVNGAVRVALELEDPSAANRGSPWGQLFQSPISFGKL